MADVIQLQAVATAANNMGDTALKIKQILVKCNGVVENDINTGLGIWDGQSAAEYATKFNEASDKIGPICDEAIAISNKIKEAVEKMGAVDGSVTTATSSN